MKKFYLLLLTIILSFSFSNAQNNVAITVFGGTKLFVESRVSDKS